MTAQEVERMVESGMWPIMGGQVDPAETPPPGSEVSPGAEAPPGPEAGGETPPEEYITIGGEAYSPQFIQDAIEALNNKGRWQGELTREAGRIKQADRALKELEAGFGRPISEWGDREWGSVGIYRNLEWRLRNQAGFYEALSSAFEQINKDLGMPGREARREAEKQVTEIERRAGTERPAQPDPRLGRLEKDFASLRDSITKREQEALTERQREISWGLLDQSLSKYAKGLPPDEINDVGSFVINRMFSEEVQDLYGNAVPRFTDDDIVRMLKDGSLAREFDRRVYARVKVMNDRFEARLKARGTAVRDGKKGAPPAPGAGGVGEAAQAESRNPESIREALHARAKAFLTGKP